MDINELSELVTKFWSEPAKQATDDFRLEVLKLAKDRLKTLADLPTLTDYFFAEPTIDWSMIEGNKQLSKLSKEEVMSLLQTSKTALESSDFNPDSIQETLNGLLEQTGQKPGILFSLIRIAVSWAPFSPALNEMLAILGKETVLSRLQKAIDN